MKYTEEDLLKYYDGGLSEERSLQLREAARHDADLADNLVAMEASQLPYKAAFDQRIMPEMPENLRTSVEHWVGLAGSAGQAPARQRLGVWTVLASAACVLASIGLGYSFALQHVKPVNDRNLVSASVEIPQSTQSAWVERVADYQSLYVENTVKGVRNGAVRAQALLEGIANRSALRTGIPDLSGEGYTFVRAQELGYMNEPLVQLVYTKPGAAPLALCYMPADGENDSPLVIDAYHGLGTASWITGGQRFVLVADESEPVLRLLQQDASTAWL